MFRRVLALAIDYARQGELAAVRWNAPLAAASGGAPPDAGTAGDGGAE